MKMEMQEIYKLILLVHVSVDFFLLYFELSNVSFYLFMIRNLEL